MAACAVAVVAAKLSVSARCGAAKQAVVLMDRQVGAAHASSVGAVDGVVGTFAACPNVPAAVGVAGLAVVRRTPPAAPAQRVLGRVLEDIGSAAAAGPAAGVAGLSGGAGQTWPCAKLAVGVAVTAGLAATTTPEAKTQVGRLMNLHGLVLPVCSVPCPLHDP